MRYVFHAPSNWVHATTTTLCQIGLRDGRGLVHGQGEHIRITFVPVPALARETLVVELVALVTGAFYLGGLLYAVWLDAEAAIWKFGFSGEWAPEQTPGPPNWPLPSIGKAALCRRHGAVPRRGRQHLIRHVMPKRR